VLTREVIIASIGELSVTPRVIRRLSTLLKEVNPDLDHVVAVLKTEPVLTAAIIVTSNAPTHFRGEKLTSIESAVRRIGLRETYRLALLITFRQGLKVPNLPDNGAADALWARAIIAGCAMEELALVDEGPMAFTLGVLHLVGCFILARAGAGLASFDNMSAAAFARAQEASLGVAYPEAGAVALEQWEFPPEIREPIRYQLEPEKAQNFVRWASLLARAAELAAFIEESRPDSAQHRTSPRHRAPVDALALTVEERSMELIECFHAVPPGRPAWAKGATAHGRGARR
jgi:HD-like signal output (HDOD) protein